MEFGKLIRQLRDEAGLTQSALAGRVGLSRTSITNIELGQQHIPIHVLYTLASALGVAPEKLLPKYESAMFAGSQVPLTEDVAEELNKQALHASTKRWIQRVVMKSALVTGESHDSEKPGTTSARRSRKVRNS